METASPTTCAVEPWGRYSASGGLYSANGTDYIYSFGGDTGSDADGRGGVVRTNFRFNLASRCWERLGNSPTEIGYRATATRVKADTDGVYVLFGSNENRVATNHLYRYSLLKDAWTLLDTTPNVPPGRWKHAAVALDESRILVTGGRDGAIVRNDAWILNTMDLSWTPLQSTGLPPMYRHGLAFDPTRNVTWIYGGLDNNLSRYQSQLWQLSMANHQVTEWSVNTTTANPLPPQLASHAMEYVAELDALLLWGGTCGDDSELHVYDIQQNSWCRISPANRPDRRDAHLWAIQFPRFYVAQGDIICYNRQLLTIADVHALDLQSLKSWEILYKPTNIPRGTGTEEYCDGNNAGNCQPAASLKDTSSRNSTCSADLLSRFFSASVAPTDLSTLNTATSFAPTPATAMASQACSQACPHSLPLLWVILMAVKLLGGR
jgi:hypothetical protein